MTRFVEVPIQSKPKPEPNHNVLDGARIYLLRSEGKAWSEIQAITGATTEATARAACTAYAKMKDLYPLT